MKNLIVELFVSLFLIAHYANADDLTATVVNATTGASNGSINLGVTGGIVPYEYIWSGPDGFVSTNQNIEALSPGEYCVIVSDHFCGIANLCITITDGAQSVGNAVLTYDLQVFPNPATTFILLKSELFSSSNYVISISTMLGNNVYSKMQVPNSTEINIDISNLPSAVYMVRVSNVEGAILSTRKFFK